LCNKTVNYSFATFSNTLFGLLFNIFPAGNPELNSGLLTVDFNLRGKHVHHPHKSRMGRYFRCVNSVAPCGAIVGVRCISLRRLKSTVNKVTSLRDFATNKKRAATPVNEGIGGGIIMLLRLFRLDEVEN